MAAVDLVSVPGIYSHARWELPLVTAKWSLLLCLRDVFLALINSLRLLILFLLLPVESQTHD